MVRSGDGESKMANKSLPPMRNARMRSHNDNQANDRATVSILPCQKHLAFPALAYKNI